MINTKTYISKSNTIIQDSCTNTGKNAILELNYGKDLSRILLYFDHTKVQKMVDDKAYPDISKLKHVLRLTNAASINEEQMNCGIRKGYDADDIKQRAMSFDVIFFLIPNEWDCGHGASFYRDFFKDRREGFSDKGSNWYQYRDYFRWEEEGIYSTSKLSKEMDLYTSKNGNLSSIIFGHQHFEIGNEDIEFDITCIFNKFLINELPNYGIGIAFAPSYEETETDYTQYVGFFSNNTHTFFEPYVETTYDEVIADDRANFYLDKDNRLYFYASVGGRYVNLDENPICTINSVQIPSKQATKGVYYVDINLSSEEVEADTMVYDEWSNIIYNGKRQKDVEMSFVTKANEEYFSFGLPSKVNKDNDKFIPLISGISHLEKMLSGDIRKVVVSCRKPYTSDEQYAVDGVEYRLYVNEGEKQYTVIDWSETERAYTENYFLINTADLIPSRYHIDIRIKYNTELIHHYDLLSFDIVSDVTNIKK